MHIKKTLCNKRLQSGVSLIELMISIALGLLLLGAATAMTVSSMIMNADTLNSARLNQNLDAVTQVMVNDIRRAGYSANFDPDFVDVEFVDNEDLNIVSASCILYAYNLNGDSILDDEEKFGFKLDDIDSDGISEIHMRTDCDAGVVSCSTDCDAGNWVALTDDRIISIISLDFTSENSKCLNLTHSEDPAIGNRFWITTLDSATEFPCMAAGGTGLINYVQDPSTYVYAAEAFAAPEGNDRLVGTRQVNIGIEAVLASDTDMEKNMNVSISVRNHDIRIIPTP